MKIIQETINTDAAVISETACTKEEKLWTCDDDIKVIQNNHVKEDNRQTIVAGLGTAILCNSSTHIQKGE